MKYPENIKTPKAKAVYWFFMHLYVFEQGKGAVVGRFTNMFMEVGMLYTALMVSGVALPKAIWILMLVGAGGLCYLIGYFYLKYSVDKINNMVNVERNPFMKEVYREVKEKDDL